MLLHVNLDSLAARREDLSRRFFSAHVTIAYRIVVNAGVLAASSALQYLLPTRPVLTRAQYVSRAVVAREHSP